MDQIERIKHMERNLDETAAAVKFLSSALEQYAAVQRQIRELADYCDSGDWLKDHDDDCAGKLPKDLKRGVLSQDAVYDLLTEDRTPRSIMQSFTPPE